jgi:hypothetical protein
MQMPYVGKRVPIYDATPGERLLELLQGFGGIVGLESLPQAELANIYCERTADSVFAMKQTQCTPSISA